MKINWGFGIAAAYIIFALCMILFVVKASQQHYDLVNTNYYNEAINYQQKIDAKNNAAANNSKLVLNYTAATQLLNITVMGETKSISGNLYFYKPDKASDDFKADFTTDEAGKQAIVLQPLAPGWWRVNASWTLNGKECLQEEKIFIAQQ